MQWVASTPRVGRYNARVKVPPDGAAAAAADPDESDVSCGDAGEASVEDRGGESMVAGGRIVGLSRPVTVSLAALGRPFEALLHYPAYRLMWTGAVVSNVVSWMQNIARDWLVYELSGDAGKFYLGLNGFVEGAAVTLLLPLGGILADRVDRRKLLVVVNALQAVLAGGWHGWRRPANSRRGTSWP